MQNRLSSIEIYLNRVAFMTALAVSLLPPVAYFALEAHHRTGSLEIEARAKADIISNYIARNPDSWHFQKERLTDLLRFSILPHTETRLYGPDDELMVQTGTTDSDFAFTRMAAIYNHGQACGMLEVTDAIDDITTNSLLVALISLLCGIAAFYVLRHQPLLALRQSQQALNAELAHHLETERELRLSNERLADANRIESVGRLAAGVAHEVKNPLAIIRFGLDYLSTRITPGGSETEVLADIKDAVERADGIVNGLLDFARNKSIARDSIDLNAIVRQALNLVRHDLSLRQIKIDQALEDPLPSLLGDPNRLLQVFVNLLTNASQAIGQKGQISVATRAITLGACDLRRDATDSFNIGDRVIVAEIRDDGPGLAGEVAEKAFDPFFTTKPIGEGTGLGLSIVRNIVMIHDGTLDLRNHPAGGAVATLTFKLGRT